MNSKTNENPYSGFLRIRKNTRQVWEAVKIQAQAKEHKILSTNQMILLLLRQYAPEEVSRFEVDFSFLEPKSDSKVISESKKEIAAVSE
jgi:hypothetical protein